MSHFTTDDFAKCFVVCVRYSITGVYPNGVMWNEDTHSNETAH